MLQRVAMKSTAKHIPKPLNIPNKTHTHNFQDNSNNQQSKFKTKNFEVNDDVF